MTTDLEKTLARELHEVADAVPVPAMPSLTPSTKPRRRAAHVWQPLVAAAAVVSVIGVLAFALTQQDSGDPQPAQSPTPNATPSPSRSPDVTIPDSAPTGPDGEPLVLGNIVLGGIEPVQVGKQVSGYIRQGYLVADPNPPCEGNNWLWAGQLSEGLYVSASQDGTIGALGTDKDGLETADGIGIGSSLRTLKATYGEFLAQVGPDDQGVGWAYVKEGNGWIAFSLGPADQVTNASRVDFIEVGTGEVLHHFNDAC